MTSAQDNPDGRSPYDIVVVGAGPVGENAAARARQHGLSVCIVESRLLGGECSYYACIPTKAMLRPLHARVAASRVRGVRGATVDAAQVLARRDGFTGLDPDTGGIDDSGQAEWLDNEGIDLIRGQGRLVGPRQVRVETTAGASDLRARHAVVLATGSFPSVPPIDGLRDSDPWTNVDASTTAEVPDRLVVLGGGVVACEFGQAFAGLGSTVTLLERGSRVLGRFEPFVSEQVTEGLRAAGVTVRTGTEVTGVLRRPDGTVAVTLSDDSVLEGDQVLVALGRRPSTVDVGVESVGLEAGQYVEVDETLRATGVPDGWLYAVGDVNGRNLLTHMGKYQARVAGDVIAARAAGRADDAPGMTAWADDTGTTQVVFTDPEVCSVGLTEEGARGRGLEVRVVEVPMSSAAGAALQADGYQGTARLVVDERRRVVVGATFVGQDTAELLQSATVAVAGAVPLDRLWHAVPPFPTMSEVWLRLLEAYGL